MCLGHTGLYVGHIHLSHMENACVLIETEWLQKTKWGILAQWTLDLSMDKHIITSNRLIAVLIAGFLYGFVTKPLF